MLFLNAGRFSFDLFADVSPAMIENVVNVNVLHVIYLLKAMLP